MIKPCVVCGEEFEPRVSWGVVCGPVCRAERTKELFRVYNRTPKRLKYLREYTRREDVKRAQAERDRKRAKRDQREYLRQYHSRLDVQQKQAIRRQEPKVKHDSALNSQIWRVEQNHQAKLAQIAAEVTAVLDRLKEKKGP